MCSTGWLRHNRTGYSEEERAERMPLLDTCALFQSDLSGFPEGLLARRLGAGTLHT